MSEPLSVPSLCAQIGGAIEQAFPHEVWVSGSISGLSRSPAGHVYFDLVHPDQQGQSPAAMVSVALFATPKMRVNAILKKSGGSVRMADGVEINIRGSVEHYPKTGKVQLIMSLIDPAYTLGKLAESREAALAALESEGLLRLQRAKSLPSLPMRIALVTSEGSAAEADFRNELGLSGWGFHITLFDTRVQGDGAPASLAAAISAAGQEASDAVVVIRGGGAKTDLIAFDHLDVARAIARCPAPVIVGVGHEIDRSIADEVCCQSAKTPTAAAGILIDHMDHVEGTLRQVQQRLADLTRTRSESAGQQLKSLANRIGMSAMAATSNESERHGILASRINAASTRVLDRSDHLEQQAALRIAAVDPTRLMERGWSVTRTADGEVLSSIDDVSAGAVLVTTVKDGEIRSEVQ